MSKLTLFLTPLHRYQTVFRTKHGRSIELTGGFTDALITEEHTVILDRHISASV